MMYREEHEKVNLKDIEYVQFNPGQNVNYFGDFPGVRLITQWKQKLVKKWTPIDKSLFMPTEEKDAIVVYWLDIEHPEAERLKNAFNHAIKLCGGGKKEEKF